MNPISQPPERTEYTYELEQLQLTNTSGVGRGALAHYYVLNSYYNSTLAWESNPPPPIIKHMCLYPGLAIVAHAQYSKLNELKWRQWLHSRILRDNDYFQPFS